MTKKIDFYHLFYRFFNLIYKKNFPVYKWLYFKYKNFMDRREIGLMKKIIKPGMTVIDVGANIGIYSVLLANLVGRKGKVHAFEPEIANFKHLKHVCEKYQNVTINRVAVDARSGEINLFVSDDLNVDHLAYDDASNRHRVRVSCISLDKYIGNKTPVDFVKIDTQGYEHQVLLGMKRVIQNSPKIIIMAEFSAYDLSLAGTDPEEHVKLVKRLGLKTYVLGKKFGFTNESDLLTKNPNRAIYYNLLYVKGNQSINF